MAVKFYELPAATSAQTSDVFAIADGGTSHKAINIRRDSPLLVAAAAASMPERTEAERAEVLRQSFASWSAL